MVTSVDIVDTVHFKGAGGRDILITVTQAGGVGGVKIRIDENACVDTSVDSNTFVLSRMFLSLFEEPKGKKSKNK